MLIKRPEDIDLCAEPATVGELRASARAVLLQHIGFVVGGGLLGGSMFAGLSLPFGLLAGLSAEGTLTASFLIAVLGFLGVLAREFKPLPLSPSSALATASLSQVHGFCRESPVCDSYNRKVIAVGRVLTEFDAIAMRLWIEGEAGLLERAALDGVKRQLEDEALVTQYAARRQFLSSSDSPSS